MRNRVNREREGGKRRGEERHKNMNKEEERLCNHSLPIKAIHVLSYLLKCLVQPFSHLFHPLHVHVHHSLSSSLLSITLHLSPLSPSLLFLLAF